MKIYLCENLLWRNGSDRMLVIAFDEKDARSYLKEFGSTKANWYIEEIGEANSKQERGCLMSDQWSE